MIPAELLARLAPEVARFDPGTSTSPDTLRNLDLAAALAPGPYYLARVAWIDDRHHWQDLIGLVVEQLGAKPGAVWLAVIEMAVAAFCWPPLCRCCAGHGSTRTGRVCVMCNGSGKGKELVARLTSICGVTAGDWRWVWAGRYERAYRLAAAWGDEAIAHFSRRLGN